MGSKKSKKRKKIIIGILILVVLGGLSAAAVLRKKEIAVRIESEAAALRDRRDRLWVHDRKVSSRAS